MKRLLCLTLIVMLTLCACSTQPQGNVTTPTPTETEEPTMPEPTIHPDRNECSVPKDPVAAPFQRLTYKVIGNRELKLWFQAPTKQVYEKAPIIFMFPGGGLMACDISSPFAIYSAEMDDLNRNGFACITIDYRIGGANGEGVTPHEIVSDCMDAIRYISYYSDILKVDTSNIITTGHSAGGMLSILTAYAPHSLFDADGYWSEADFRIVGAFALSPNTIFFKGEDGPYDGYYSKTSPDTSLWSTEELRQLCSPINYVNENSVPCTILIGTHDEWVSSEGVRHFARTCQEADVSLEIFWFKNANHGFQSANGEPVSPNYNAVRALITSYAVSWLQEPINP